MEWCQELSGDGRTVVDTMGAVVLKVLEYRDLHR